MGWNDKNASHNGIEERGFDLTIADNSVPGILWVPMDRPSKRLVLLGHGGTSHKKVEHIVQVARMLSAKGIASVTIDALGTRKGTLHANPGRHQAVPQFELAGSADYLDRPLR